MKTPERFDRALKKLIQAFFSDGLRKGNCSACAVGNMCDGKSDWRHVFMSSDHGQIIYVKAYVNNYISPISSESNPKLVIDATGYSWQELARVEKAFEANTKIDGAFGYSADIHKKDIMEDQFNGLMAVVEVLCDIEGLNPEPYKIQFNYNEEFQPVINTKA